MTGEQTSFEIELTSEAETENLGCLIATHLQAGDVVALIGSLGAGKTRLVQAIASRLGIPPGVVNSPTFMLIQEYPGCIPLRHCDVYRLKSRDEFPELGLDELFATDGIALVEWADRVIEFLPDDRLDVRIEPTGLTARRVTLTGHSVRGNDLLLKIQSSITS